MSNLSGIGAAFMAWADKAENEIVAVAEAIVPPVVNVLEVGLADLADIAGTAMMAQVGKVMSGTEKFGTAVTDVIQTVEAQGKVVALQTAQSAVQQAYLAAQAKARQILAAHDANAAPTVAPVTSPAQP